MKQYVDKRRNAHLTPGDKVLARQEQRNKLSTLFAPEPYDVITKNGNSVVIESSEGVQSMQNTTHVKKYEEPSPSPDETTSVLDDTARTEPEPEIKGQQPNFFQTKSSQEATRSYQKDLRTLI